MRILFEFLSAGRTLEEFIEAFDEVPRDKVLGILKVSSREMERGAFWR